MSDLPEMADAEELYTLGGIPIDRMTWRVIGKGETWEPKKKIRSLVFDRHPGLPGMNHAVYEMRPDSYKGHKIGRMLVVGYWGKSKKKKGAGADHQLWLCRCPCGMFVTRTAKAIRGGRDPDDKCEYCRELAYLKRLDYKNTHGHWPDQPRKSA